MADSKGIIKCPACGALMEKVYIPSENINIDICTGGCGGIFFDNREFDKFNEQNEDISIIIKKLDNPVYKPVEDNKKKMCPVCNTPMVQNKTSVGGNIVIDECYGCGGKFLDNGELEKIRAEFATDADRSKATMEYLNKKIGKEMAIIDTKYQANKKDKTLAQKLFFAIMGI